MRIGPLLLFFVLIMGVSAQAVTRVFDVTYGGKKFYAVTLHPLRISPFRVGSILRGDGDELGLILAETNKDGASVDHNYSAQEYLFYSGKAPNFGAMDAETLTQIRSSVHPEELAHALEMYLFRAFEKWSIQQYLKRGRIAGDLEARIRRELADIKDGYGWIAILDEDKNILSTLAVAARTRKAPQFPLEKSHRVNIGDLPYRESKEYPIIGSPIRAPRTMAPVLTLELKRFISSKANPFYVFLLCFTSAKRAE